MRKIMHTYLRTLNKLWNTCESLHFNCIRLKRLPLILAMPFAVKRSIWHMWNIYFILTTIGMLGLLLDTTGVLIQVSLVICGIAAGIGYITVFYMGAGIIKRNFSMSFFKKTLIAFIILLMVAILLSGIAASLFPGELLVITAAISGLSLIVVTILSPVIYKNLFSHDWMEDFAKKDMIPAGDDFNGYGFTDREKEVCRLLLDGYTLRQIASILKLACGLWHGNKGSCRIDDGEDL